MRTFLCSLAVLAAGYSNAAVIVDSTVTQLENGLSSVLVTLTSDGQALQTFDFLGDGTSDDPMTDSGFFGPFNQVQFFGQATVNNNFATPVPGSYDPLLDTRFLVATADVAVTLGEVESGSVLKALYSYATPRGQSFDIARLVLPTSALGVVNYGGVVVLADGSEVAIRGMLPGGTPVIPEPSTLALAGLAIAGVMLRRRAA